MEERVRQRPMAELLCTWLVAFGFLLSVMDLLQSPETHKPTVTSLTAGDDATALDTHSTPRFYNPPPPLECPWIPVFCPVVVVVVVVRHSHIHPFDFVPFFSVTCLNDMSVLYINEYISHLLSVPC